MAKKLVCDRCSKDIGEGAEFYSLVSKDGKEIDFCQDCWLNFQSWMNPAQQPAQAAPAPQPVVQAVPQPQVAQEQPQQ